MSGEQFITPEVRALVGAESPIEWAWDPVTTSELRRFTQAIMDSDPVHWDEKYAERTKYGGVVCPPLFPLTYFRTSPSEPDPISQGARQDPEFDGAVEGMLGTRGLPSIPLPLARRLHGGNDIQVFQLAKPGERLKARSRIVDIHQREGRSGPMVFVVTETTIWNHKDELLLISRQTIIRR